jgi:hypothetical protein
LAASCLQTLTPMSEPAKQVSPTMELRLTPTMTLPTNTPWHPGAALAHLTAPAIKRGQKANPASIASERVDPPPTQQVIPARGRRFLYSIPPSGRTSKWRFTEAVMVRIRLTVNKLYVNLRESAMAAIVLPRQRTSYGKKEST